MKKEMKKGTDKKKGLRVSIAVHACLVLIALLPFMTQLNKAEDAYPIVQIEFINDAITSGAASEAPKKIEEVKVEKEEVKEVKEEVVEKPNPKPTPKPTPIVVDDTPAEVVVEEVKEEPVEEVVLENDIVEEKAAETTEDNSSTETVEVGKETDGDKGEGDKGTKITGKSLGEMDFEGEGIFGRKVIYRADVKKITEREGTVVVNLCVNRHGVVTHVAFNREASTIYESEYIKRALNVASDYLFEKDYTAPETQCGKLSFRFIIR